MQVSSFTGAEKLPEALYGSSLVVIPAGVPRKPGMTRDDLFNINAGESPTLASRITLAMSSGSQGKRGHLASAVHLPGAHLCER